MTNVKMIFFITEEEAKDLRKTTGKGYIFHKSPHYELEDGTIMYAMWGAPAAGEVWYESVKETQ